MKKHTIITLKNEGHSNREVARLLGINRKTVGRYWNDYCKQIASLQNSDLAINDIQENICSEPVYNTQNRKSRKYSKEMDLFLDEILSMEKEKCKLLKTTKQKLTQEQIYGLFVEKGYEISRSTIANKIREKRNTKKECFVRQSYEFGERLEYDFGEVKLLINGEVGTYHMAVFSSPAADFRWAYLYRNQKKEVFMDSHVKFFEMVKGVYKEVVYDNMRNVVSKFIGPHEKELNENLLKLSLYYGFLINVTNCYSGNEKGHVEGSVKIIRNKVFSRHYKFKTFEEACQYLQEELKQLNQKSNIQQELKCLQEYKPPLELANLKTAVVDKYSFVRVSKNFYSVPDYLVDKTVSVKEYLDTIKIYANHHFVCEHKKIDGVNEIGIDINHYLDTFTKKPGALKNSLALKSLPQLKSIYDSHFTKNPKDFIALLKNNAEKTIDEMITMLSKEKSSSVIMSFEQAKKQVTIGELTRSQTSKYNNICLKGGQQYGN